MGPLRHGPQRQGAREGPRPDPRAPRGVLAFVLRVPGNAEDLNPWLEKAGRVADFLEFGELMCHDALATATSPAAVTSAKGVGVKPKLHKEQLEFEYVKLTTRSYK